MAITYNISRCRNGWGVYVRAISGDDLKFIAPTTDLSVARVTSGRLARKRSKLAAKNFITRLQSETDETQRERLLRCWIKVAPAAYKVIRVQNLKLFRETTSGQFIPTFTTIDRIYAEKVALYYSQERNKKSFLRKSVTKYLKLPLNTDDSTLNKI